jgi:hypothetical protein
MNSKLEKKLKTLNLSKVLMSVGVTLTTRPHVVPRSLMSRGYTPLPQNLHGV